MSNRSSLWLIIIASVTLALGLSSCSPKGAEPPATNPSGEATPPPAKMPSYEELLGPKLAEKMKQGGPWSFEDLEPLHQAMIKLKQFNDSLSSSSDNNLKAAAKQRHSELSATYTTLKQVQASNQQPPAPAGEPANVDSAQK